jgi:hypothetical protein
VFCYVRSAITGARLVSLPFSDHCDPLVDGPQELATLCDPLIEQRRARGWSYIELRPRQAPPLPGAFAASDAFWLHVLNLRPGLDALFRGLHKDSVQRKIRRAQREALEYEDGHTEDLLRRFYRLLLLTRRRHGVPPQPFEWFRNLALCFRESLKVRLASIRGEAIAAMITLHHRDVMVYKYGASNAIFHPMGGMQLLFWNAIQDARRGGCVALDLGRTAQDNVGLLTFKDRWGAARQPLVYSRCPAGDNARGRVPAVFLRCARQVVRFAPDGVWNAAGRFLYKHVG